MQSDDVAIQIFKKFDKDNSGSIDKNELKAMLEETYKGLNYAVTDKDVEDALSSFDTDKSGTISQQEYVDMVRKAYTHKNQ